MLPHLQLKTVPYVIQTLWVVVGGRCQDNIHQLHVQQSFTYEKPQAASAVLGS
jgi:hypothetical protein